ncbi:MAG TPA: malectin domain-containing carbohydrate-binding protein [Rudaea sp.]
MKPIALARRLLLAAAFAANTAFAATPADFLSGTYSGMPYRYFVPPGYNAANAYPLILFLHGVGEEGSDNSAQLNNNANGAMHLVDAQNLAVQPVFMVAPQCPSGGWWGGATTATAIAIIDQIAASYHIDPDRVYVTGLSMGGYGTWDAVTQQPTRFAAAVPMSGGGDTNAAASVANLPFWFFHANNDPTVGVAGSDNLVAALRDAGASVIYTRYDTGGHGIWPVGYVTPMLFNWIVAQRRGAPSTSAPPLLRIETPTTGSAFATQDATLNLTGSALFGGNALNSIAWNLRGGIGGTGGGTTSWSIVGVPIASGANLVRVIATGTSFSANYGGATTFNDALTVNRIGPPPAIGSTVVAINAGGDALAAMDGTTYAADSAYSGGAVQVSNVAVANTADDALYNNWRYGNTVWHLAVYPGRYRVELHFAETYNSAAGQRKFDVFVENTNVLHEFDIAAAAGVNTALIQTFDADVADSTLDIEIRNGSIGNARLDAFRVIAGADDIFKSGFDVP